MKFLSFDELQKNFDVILNRVQLGESFLIKYEGNDFALIPYQLYKEADETIRMYTDHEEGC